MSLFLGEDTHALEMPQEIDMTGTLSFLTNLTSLNLARNTSITEASLPPSPI